MTSTSPAPSPPASVAPESVIIRPWPKLVFLYPTFVVSTLFFLFSWLDVVPSDTLGNLWMAVFLLNLLVFSFDFSRLWSIVLVFAIGLLVVLVLWLDLTGFVGNALGKVQIPYTPSHYGFMSAGLGLLLAIVWVNSRFHYYEVNAREILHHHGYLSDVTRWSTEGLEMNKEINDIAEYVLLRSGRLIFHPASSKKAIVLDNVAAVNRIEKSVNDLLSVVAVRLNQGPGPG